MRNLMQKVATLAPTEAIKELLQTPLSQGRRFEFRVGNTWSHWSPQHDSLIDSNGVTIDAGFNLEKISEVRCVNEQERQQLENQTTDQVRKEADRQERRTTSRSEVRKEEPSGPVESAR